MKMLIRIIVIALCLVLIPVAAIATAAAKQRFADGPNRVFSGGALEAGELHTGAEPDWRFVSEISTIEMQLLDPPKSRRIWTAEYDGKIYVWSGYMATAVGRVWKRWPLQAERDGRAMMRIDGKRYERQLVRIKSGPILDGISTAIRNKYPSQTTRATVEAGETWLFEAAPRN
ncbi:MAG TPA: hypothetical protein EYQ30_08490 [Gammaproteobacteria bacterium]|jgi:hypothetical protein|nr:hypothetical protein [Gammaproteobacteria bacterium]HIF86848.1 hypothetical protein [Gammaproteobacteria bacterium]HIL62157.1 hypothetical protein [Porticoccaceae bacterium]|tara:strand:- start:202 stop:720 length:519 start_codon:yes stop_codon:yes gene_type:complete